MNVQQTLVAKRTRGRPSPDQQEAIESELLDGALREFVKSGYGGTSINKIVKALGISKTTVYARYPTKEALFRAIVLRQIDRLAAGSALSIDGTLLELGMGLRAYGNRTLEISLGELREVNRLINAEAQRFPELGAAAAEHAQIGVRQIAEFIIQCAERDGVPVRNPYAIAEAFIFMNRGWYMDALLTGRDVTPAERERWVENAVHTLMADRASW